MFDTFASPFSHRYGSEAMRALWSERHKRLLWRRVWVALAEAQAELGIISADQAADLRAHMQDVDARSIARALELEREIHHDLMAELRVFAEQCPLGGSVLHLGATSMDIEDNAEALRLREALALLRQRVHVLMRCLAEQVLHHADRVCMAFTHLQPAEPTTVGYRLAQTLQDLMTDEAQLRELQRTLRGKGFKGAVGTAASYAELGDAAAMEQRALQKLGLEAFAVATQTYPRKQEWLVLNALASLAQTLYKFAFDLRVLQSPPIGEWREPFGAKQIGSSAMPFKRNPILAERINSLARFLAALPRVAWDNAAHSLLERTLDDSANRRALLPEAFLAAEEITLLATRVVCELHVDERNLVRTFEAYAPFAATERVLVAAVKAGADRQAIHARLRELALRAWDAIAQSGHNPLIELICADPEVTRYLAPEIIRALMNASTYVGDAPERARVLARQTLAYLGAAGDA